MKKIILKTFKWTLRIFLTLVLGIGLYIGGFMLFHNDIPKTKPNSNDSELGKTSIVLDSLENRWGDKILIEQGSIVVKENREIEGSNNISVSFIKIPTSSPAPKSPIFFLAGGPGTPGSSVAKRDFFYVFKKLSEYADVVLIDQRGTGNSIPNLRCRNTLDIPSDNSEVKEKDILRDVAEKCKECAEEFTDLNIDLRGYTSEESARDIEEIRKALNMDKITLFGYSYGTALAQHYIRLYEEHVDQLVFAGSIAPDMGLSLPAQKEDQYRVMDSLIAKDKKMKRYIPSFTALMEQEHKKLKENPLNIKLPLMNAVNENDGFIPVNIFRAISIVKPNWEFTISNTHMQMMMAQNTGRDAWTQIAPKYYYQLSNGEYQRLGNYFRNFSKQNVPNALFFTEAASTRYSDERWKQVSSHTDENLLSHFSISFGRYKEVLDGFNVPKNEKLSEPVFSEKSVLFIAGTLDGRTPVTLTDSISKRFKNSTKLIVENGSHNNLVKADVLDEIVKFIKNEDSIKTKLKRDFNFLTPVDYKYSISDTLEVIRKKKGIVKALNKFEELFNEYSNQDDYYFDVSESSLNSYGYILLSKDLVSDAIEVFKLYTELFSDSSNAFNSLAEGYIANGDYKMAINNLKKAIEMNYLDGYSRSLLKKYNNDNYLKN